MPTFNCRVDEPSLQAEGGMDFYIFIPALAERERRQIRHQDLQLSPNDAT